MKQNGLGKLYDRLTPEERFRLDVLAMARGIWRSPSFSPERAPGTTTL